MKQAIVPIKKNPKRDENFKRSTENLKELSEKLALLYYTAKNNHRFLSKMTFGKLYMVKAQWQNQTDREVNALCSPRESNKGALHLNVFWNSTYNSSCSENIRGFYISKTMEPGWEILSVKPVPITDLPKYLNAPSMTDIIEYNMKGKK